MVGSESANLWVCVCLTFSKTWLDRLGESSLVKDTWLERNVVNPLKEGSVGSVSSTDISGSRTARAGPRHEERTGSSTHRPSSSSYRSGATTDRYGGGSGNRRSLAAPERGGRDLVEHLRNLELSLRDGEHSSRSDRQRRTEQRKTQSERERDHERDRDREQEREREKNRQLAQKEASPEKQYSRNSATLALHLASPRILLDPRERARAREADAPSPYLKGLASPRGVPPLSQSAAFSRAGLLASPRAPPGLRCGIHTPTIVPRCKKRGAQRWSALARSCRAPTGSDYGSEDTTQQGKTNQLYW